MIGLRMGRDPHAPFASLRSSALPRYPHATRTHTHHYPHLEDGVQRSTSHQLSLHVPNTLDTTHSPTRGKSQACDNSLQREGRANKRGSRERAARDHLLVRLEFQYILIFSPRFVLLSIVSALQATCYKHRLPARTALIDPFNVGPRRHQRLHAYQIVCLHRRVKW